MMINISNKQRLISSLAGLALIGAAIRGLKTPTAKKWVGLVTGSLLLLRGASGFCPVTEALKEKGEMDILF